MVCQNQSIDVSDADLAHDLRVLVRERIKAGDTDEQVLDYVVARYGVIRAPQAARFSLRNALLWGAAAGAGAARRRPLHGFRAAGRKAKSEARLTAEEDAALAKVLRGEG